MRRWLRLGLLFPAGLLAQGVAGGDARPVSLEEAVRLARLNSPQMVAARGQLKSTDAAVRTAFSTYLPSLSFSASSSRSEGQNFTPQGELREIVSPWNFTGGLNTNIELFDGGRRLFNLRNAQAEQSAAESNRKLQEYRIELDVKREFFAILAARESRSAALAQLAQAEQQLKVATARLAAGAATKSDSLRSIIAVGNAQLSVLNADNNLRVANANLTRIVGVQQTVTASIGAEELLPSTQLDPAEVQRWVNDAPSIAQARAQVNATKSASRATRSPYLPTFSVGASLNGNRSDRDFSPLGGPVLSSKSLRLSFNYPLFNTMQREENVARASIAEQNAVAQLRDAQLAAEQQVTQLLGSLRLAEARIGIQVASVAAGEEDLRVQNQRYALGSSTLLDVLTSQSTLNQARFSLIQARYDARLAKAQIEALLGRTIS